MREEYKSRGTFPWSKLENLFHNSDLVIGNLEGAVGNEENQINSSAPSPVFAIDNSDIGLLVKAGFNALTVENNHTLDLGLQGKVQTISALIDNNIKSIALENSPYFFDIKGLKISIIAFNLIRNRDSSKYQVPSIEIQQKIRLAKTFSDVVIVSVHWGSELLEWPDKDQREVAKYLISKGVDVIIGHHPHVIQQPELVDGKPVYFSLGNHLFDQKYPGAKEGLIAEIEIKNGKIICNGIKTHSQKNSFYPEIDGNTISYFKPLVYRKQDFAINGIAIVPENIAKVNKTILKAYSKDQLLWKSHPMALVTLQTIKIDEKEHLFTLESYYSPLDKEINIRPYVYAIDRNGITARWRGSALAWPILDALTLPSNKGIICALHRGDAFIAPGKAVLPQKVAAYKWNGFGFNSIADSTTSCDCEELY